MGTPGWVSLHHYSSLSALSSCHCHTLSLTPKSGKLMRAHTAWVLLHFGKAGAGLCQDQGIHVGRLSEIPADRDADLPLWEKTGCGIS